MTVFVANVDVSADSFGQWLTKTNQLAEAMSNVAVTVGSNTAVGSATITGNFTANNLVTSNTGSVLLGTASSNSYINATSVVIRTSSTANTVLTSAGMTIDGVTTYTKTSMSMGNTTIRGANITSNVALFSDSVTVGNSYFTRTTVRADQANALNAWTSNTHVVGDVQANVYITRDALEVYSNPTGSLVQNSKLTSTTLYVKNIFAEAITLSNVSASSIFTGNTVFLGQNNYFEYGITVNGQSEFFNNVVFTANVNFIGANNHFTNGLRSSNISYFTGDVIANAGIDTTDYIKFNGITSGSTTLRANNAAGSATFILPTVDGTNQDYIGTDGSGKLTFQKLTGNNTINFQVKSIGVGTAAPGTTGQIRATGDITAFYSDDRLKTRLGDITEALDKVEKLTGFYYKANDKAKELGYDDNKIQVGLSAQQVQEVLPYVVVPAPVDENYLTIQYEKLIPLLVEAIKELKAEVDKLKNGN